MRTKIVLACVVLAFVAIGMIDLGCAVPSQKTFQFSDFGNYKAVDSQGKTYFVGYDNGLLYDNSNTKTLSDDQVSEVLRDSNAEWEISTYVPLVLKEGYQLRIKSIDVDGEKVYVELDQNGLPVDSKVIQPYENITQMRDQTYLYKSTLGNAKGIIQIAVHFKNVHRANHINIAAIDGIWQISKNVQASTPLSSPCNAVKCHLLAGTCCNGNCVKLQTDNNNCGKCGNECGNLRKCIAGKCVLPLCSKGQTNCNGECLDTQTDRRNCGCCGYDCDSPNGYYGYCKNGLCSYLAVKKNG